MELRLSGKTGMLGSAIAQIAHQRQWRCDGLSHQEIWASSPDDLAAVLQGYDVLIHTAAWTDVERCEQDLYECYRSNFLMTAWLCRAAHQAGIPIVYVSSTGVYGTTKDTPYDESDVPQPTTHHHTSKYLSEQEVLRSDERNLVLRTGWLFGGDFANPKNFVARRIEEATMTLHSGGTIKSNSQQFGVPCWTRHIAERLLLLVETGQRGLFNCVNSDSANRIDYVKAIVELAQLPVEIQPASAESFQRKARVSNNEMALNARMNALGLPVMPHWRDALSLYLQQFRHPDAS